MSGVRPLFMGHISSLAIQEDMNQHLQMLKAGQAIPAQSC